MPKKPTPKVKLVPRLKTKPLATDDWLNGGEEAEESLEPQAHGGALRRMHAPDDDDAIESASGVVVTKQRLGVILGLAGATIDKAFANGAPVIAKGNRKQGWQINTAAFFAWYMRWKVESLTGNPGKMGFEEAKTRKAIADAIYKERENERLEGRTILIEDAVAIYREEASVIRSQLMAIPGRVATSGQAATTPQELELIVRDEIDIALQNLVSDTAESWKANAGLNSADQPDDV